MCEKGNAIGFASSKTRRPARGSSPVALPLVMLGRSLPSALSGWEQIRERLDYAVGAPRSSNKYNMSAQFRAAHLRAVLPRFRNTKENIQKIFCHVFKNFFFMAAIVAIAVCDLLCCAKKCNSAATKAFGTF